MPRQKNLPQGPRRKRMTREGRLQSATATRWLERYEGKDLIKGYGKWFAVDPLCAVTELRMLGVRIDEERENAIKTSIEGRATARKRRRESALEDRNADCNDTFAQFIGYTAGDVPYGVAWEEIGEHSTTATTGVAIEAKWRNRFYMRRVSDVVGDQEYC